MTNITLEQKLLGSTAANAARVLQVEGEGEQGASGPQPVTEASEPERKKIANRDWIDDAGKEVAEEEATGVRYEFLGRTKDGVTIPPDGNSYTVYLRDLKPAALAMAAGFGLITLMGNVTNTWMGDKSPDKDAKASEAIAARIALLNEGKWIDRTREGVGARVDKDSLAKAIVNVFTQKGKTVDEAMIRAKLESSADFLKASRANPEVLREYAVIMGRNVTTVDELASMIA